MHYPADEVSASGRRLLVRRLLNSVLICLLTVSAAALTARAQSADKILKQATRALGGEKALKNIRSWQARGTIRRLSDGATGSWQAAAMLPGLYAVTFDLQGFEISQGYNGKSGWMRDSRQGLRTLTAEAGRDFQAEAQYRNTRWLDYKKERAKVTAAGQSNLDGRPANAVILTTARGVRLKLHFDPSSGLLLREEVPAGELTQVFDYSDYRAIDGVQEPHAIRLTVGAEKYEIRLSQITHNRAPERALFDFPKISNEPLPDIPALLREVSANEDAIDQLLEKYTYTETITQRELDQNGNLKDKETQTWELTFYKGNRIRRLIAKNGKPLSGDELERENRRVEKRVREIEKKEAEKERKAQEREVGQSAAGTPNDEGERISIADVLRASRLINPRRERFRNRDVIVFDFEPLPGYKPQKKYEKFFGKNAGAIWIDAADKQVARVEARLIDSYKIAGGLLASLREGATFVLEQERVNDELWLPTRMDINLSVKVLMVKGLNIVLSATYGDYKRFNVDAERERLKDPVKP
ncbi:MAG TPA: hypothetical protein VNQ79_00100 [Blastocatellia bacterium]|nr:hypothetical protein [Blastocatellia bacterium]